MHAGAHAHTYTHNARARASRRNHLWIPRSRSQRRRDRAIFAASTRVPIVRRDNDNDDDDARASTRRGGASSVTRDASRKSGRPRSPVSNAHARHVKPAARRSHAKSKVKPALLPRPVASARLDETRETARGDSPRVHRARITVKNAAERASRRFAYRQLHVHTLRRWRRGAVERRRRRSRRRRRDAEKIRR